jgi:hypothetical protein
MSHMKEIITFCTCKNVRRSKIKNGTYLKGKCDKKPSRFVKQPPFKKRDGLTILSKLSKISVSLNITYFVDFSS